jgi:hypothetical protein
MHRYPKRRFWTRPDSLPHFQTLNEVTEIQALTLNLLISLLHSPSEYTLLLTLELRNEKVGQECVYMCHKLPYGET